MIEEGGGMKGIKEDGGDREAAATRTEEEVELGTQIWERFHVDLNTILR